MRNSGFVWIIAIIMISLDIYVFQAIKNGELEAQEHGKCTSVLRKETSGWLIRHEHCSKTKPQGMER